MSGWDDDCFLQGVEIDPDLRCPICSMVCRNAKRCRNGHDFCDACIHRALDEAEICPVCRDELTAEDLSIGRLMRKMVNKLVVYCENKDNGCPTTNPIETVTAHQHGCMFQMLPCAYGTNGCADHLLRKDLDKHVASCGYAKVTCERCNHQMLHRELREHQDNMHCFQILTTIMEEQREGHKNHVERLMATSAADLGQARDEMADFRRTQTQIMKDHAAEVARRQMETAHEGVAKMRQWQEDVTRAHAAEMEEMRKEFRQQRLELMAQLEKLHRMVGMSHSGDRPAVMPVNDTAMKLETITVAGLKSSATSMAIDERRGLLFVGEDRGKIKVYDVRAKRGDSGRLKLVRRLAQQDTPVTGLAFHADSNVLFATQNDLVTGIDLDGL